MAGVARVRRRTRIVTNDVGTKLGEKMPEEVPMRETSGIRSSARARRRARMLESELKRQEELYPPLSRTWGSEDLNFELLKQTMEQYTGEDEGRVAVSVGPTGKRTSDDFDEGRKLKLSTAQLNRMKGYLYHRDSLEVMRGKSMENYRKLYRSSLDKSLLGDTFTKDSTGPWPAGREGHSDVRILATLLPDEILQDIQAVDPKEFHAAVLFADISGFTELCQKFDKTGKGGPSRLSEILNTHVGAMIQVVLSRHGDVCKFGGDAILCFWKAPSESDLKDTICSAIDSALDMQKKCQTDAVGLSVRVKIAVSAGQVMFSTIGESDRKYYLLVGKPVLETNCSEKLCRPGDVIVTASAWKHVSAYLLYNYSLHSNKTHILVQGYGPLWNQSKLNLATAEEQALGLSGRQSLKQTGNLKLEELRPFILPFVMACIDHNEPLDYLTEMRQVAIVFLKFDINELGLSCRDTIELCDRAYRSVCRIVDRANGIVNKMTCFDKDVCVLVVFGLRGFKYDLSSKIALKCAYNCVEKLRAVSEVNVSAGVTTGMAYCGVIGHFLRREYTVMGLPVNKAARLMCAYENIVSCDRETFLQSKLQASHFEVLERRTLKGLRNAGPVYEFSLSVKRRAVLDSQGPPLLGRSKEIAEFEAFLRDYKSRNSLINFFVVYGGDRIGKTKLISTLVRIAERYLAPSEGTTGANSQETDRKKESDVEISFAALTEDDYKKSYSVVRLVVQPALGISDSSTPEEREEKIMTKLGDFKETYVLATLNPVFNVRFNLTSDYLNMQEEEQLAARRVMKKKLYKACFPSHSNWVIVIDDAEFIDEASWGVFQWCSTISNRPLYLMTVGQQKELSANASECLLSIPQKKVVLAELDKWFYTPLACQILEVKAIPVEVENLLQGFKSSGHPGWLECYLLSLIQTECLQIAYVPRSEMNKMRLVTAAEQLLTVGRKDANVVSKKESLDWSESFKVKDVGPSDIVPICILGPNFRDTYHESELTVDMMYVKAIDKLKPLELLILKAGSVLGDNFKRDALYYLISTELVIEERSFAKAIKNLFDMKLISCDRGDFTYPSSLITNRRAILRDDFQKDIKCSCIGLTKSDALQNLPDYAACGFMRFKSPAFRETVYSLLLNEQKKRFHYTSIVYIRSHTYRCKACRSILFDHVFGRDVNKKMLLVCMRTSMHGVRSTRIIFKRPSYKPTPKSMGEEDDSDDQVGTSINEQLEEGFLQNRDITECQCSQILCSVYSDLLEHADRAGRRDIMLEVYLEYASVSLTSANMPLTAKVLEETQALVKAIKDENEYPDLCSPFIFAKIYTLMGATNLSMGMCDTALRHLETALKHLGKKVPKSRSQIGIRIQQINFRKRVVTQCFPERFIGKASGRKAAYFDLLSECLGLMCMVHLYGESWNLARLTATWALNNSLRSYRNFYGLCMSCANMMDVAYHYNDRVTSSKMEMLAIDICERCSKQVLEEYELEAVARMYTTMFRTKQARGQLEDAISFGFKSLRIASIIRNSRQRLELMPELVFALVQRGRLSEAVSLLQELEFASVQYCDRIGRMWYYALCMDFQLDTGYTILPYKACEQFVNEEEENFSFARSVCATERLCTSMWLWCVRNGEWEVSKRYLTFMRHQNRKLRLRTPTSMYTHMKKLEGLLITLADNLYNRKVHVSESIASDILTIMKALKKGTKVVPLLKPRYLLLETYYACIKNSKCTGEDALRRARILADKVGDKSTFDWIIHNRLVWRNIATSAQKSFWLDHCKYGNFIDWHEAESSFGREALMYSLPLPNKP